MFLQKNKNKVNIITHVTHLAQKYISNRPNLNLVVARNKVTKQSPANGNENNNLSFWKEIIT